MLERGTGNLLEADAEALVNAVNTVGVMGKGLVLQFKKSFPANFAAYERACKAGEVAAGKMFIFPTLTLHNPRYVVNFPTKNHWRDKSKIADIRSGLAALVADVRRLGIRSIALPALGCGNGGLDWADVSPLIDAAFSTLPDVRAIVYASDAITPTP